MARGCCLGWRLVLSGSYINVLILFIPIACIIRLTRPDSRSLAFTFSVLSLIPLVKFHDIATRELAIRIGGSKAGLVNATLSNIIEIVVAISALRKCELRVVQSSLIGSMLSKLLLVLGLCLFTGGMRFSEQGFDPTATQMHSSLLSLGVGVVLLPAAYHFSLSNSSIAPQLQMKNILNMSRGVSIILLFLYGSYLFFQLCSHTHLYQDGKNKNELLRKKSLLPGDSRPVLSHQPLPSMPERVSAPRNIYSTSSYMDSALPFFVQTKCQASSVEDPLGGVPLSRDDTLVNASSECGNEDAVDSLEAPKSQEPQLSFVLILVILIIATVAVAFTADHLVESMDSVSSTIPKPYVALIILPAVSSIAECMTGVNASAKDELDFALSVAVGSTIQTGLFVIPFMVVLGWMMGRPLSLLFDPFESLVLYISVQVMTSVVSDGKSNYLEGLVLLCIWCIISVSFWFYPAWSLSNVLEACKI
ncbi:hypothetical protein C8F01DRAFT_1218182 [Mycena amicta]|nr:hypothetical protein C8F01DRAFT_1218182 [Mycena amicta]